MARKTQMVAEYRQYRVKTVADAKQVTNGWLEDAGLQNAIKLGLPEVDDRYHIWRVPLCNSGRSKVGEIVIDAFTTEIDLSKSTDREVVEARLLKKDIRKEKQIPLEHEYMDAALRNTIALGNCIELIDDLPASSIDFNLYVATILQCQT